MMPGQGTGLSPSASIRSAGKAKQVTLGVGKNRFPVRQVSDSSTTTSISKHAPTISSPLAEQDEPEPDHAESTQQSRETSSLMHNTDFASPPATQPTESPFFDASEHPTSAAAAAASSSRPNPYASMASTISTSTDGPAKNRGKSIGGLSAVDEESLKRLSRTSETLQEEEEKTKMGDESPFLDKHSID
jgi:hypothetical protein